MGYCDHLVVLINYESATGIFMVMLLAQPGGISLGL